MPISKEESPCPRVVKEPVREEERVAVAYLKTASAPIAASEYRISQANGAMRRNA